MGHAGNPLACLLLLLMSAKINRMNHTRYFLPYHR